MISQYQLHGLFVYPDAATVLCARHEIYRGAVFIDGRFFFVTVTVNIYKKFLPLCLLPISAFAFPRLNYYWSILQHSPTMEFHRSPLSCPSNCIAMIEIVALSTISECFLTPWASPWICSMPFISPITFLPSTSSSYLASYTEGIEYTRNSLFPNNIIDSARWVWTNGQLLIVMTVAAGCRGCQQRWIANSGLSLLMYYQRFSAYQSLYSHWVEAV